MSHDISFTVEAHIQHSNRLLKTINNNIPTHHPEALRKLIYQYESAIKNLQRHIPATESREQVYHTCSCLQEHPRELRLFIDRHPGVKSACRKYSEGRRLCDKCDFLVFLGPDHDLRCKPLPVKKTSHWKVPNTPGHKAAAALYNAVWSSPKGKEPVRSNSPPAPWETEDTPTVTFEDASLPHEEQPIATPLSPRPLTRAERFKNRLGPEEFERHVQTAACFCYESDCDAHRSYRNFYGRD